MEKITGEIAYLYMKNEILKRQKEHFSKDKEVHTGSNTQELEKYLEKYQKDLIKKLRKKRD